MNKIKNNLPKISIVIPCFNTVNYIERSIKSVVEQDYKNIELFIKDGGSTDGTVDIVEYYAQKYPNIIRWVSGKDKGQSDAINFGMEKVRGDILTYLNADDVYKKGALNKIANFFTENPNIMWVFGKADIIDADDVEIRKWITLYKNFWLKHYSYNTLLILNYISQMATFWRKDAAKKVGKFDATQHLVMDYDYWLRLGKKYQAGYINKYLASFRITAANKSTMGFVQQFQDEFEVSKKNTSNTLIILLHNLHYILIIIIYYFLKLLRDFSSKGFKEQSNV